MFYKWLIAFSPFIVLVYYKISEFFCINSICIWKKNFGIECIGCGITRAIIQVLKGNYHRAFELNPLVVIVFPLLLYIWLDYIYKNIIKDLLFSNKK